MDAFKLATMLADVYSTPENASETHLYAAYELMRDECLMLRAKLAEVTDPSAPSEGMTEMEMDRNWWKGTANQYKRDLDRARAAADRLEKLASGLRLCISGGHDFSVRWQWDEERSSPLVCSRCHTQEPTPRDVK